MSRCLLTATFASLRCRELADKERFVEAHVQLAILQDALWKLEGAILDVESQREIDLLVEQANKLRRLLQDRPVSSPSGVATTTSSGATAPDPGVARG